MMNSNGPSIEPCGTPFIMGTPMVPQNIFVLPIYLAVIILKHILSNNYVVSYMQVVAPLPVM